MVVHQAQAPPPQAQAQAQAQAGSRVATQGRDAKEAAQQQLLSLLTGLLQNLLPNRIQQPAAAIASLLRRGRAA